LNWELGWEEMSMNQQNITTVIAVLSFVLSIILGVIEIWRYRGRVRVKILLGHFYDGPEEFSEEVIEIRADNIGYGSVYITGGGWHKKDGYSVSIINPINLVFPIKLEERRSISIYYPCRWFNKFENVNNIVSAYVRDETGKEWKCRLSNKDLQKLLKCEPYGWLIGMSKDNKKYYRKPSEGGESIPLHAEGFISHKI
jgi:hypothetical protein